MLRIYFLQQRYALADEALKDALYEIQAMRSFAGTDLSVEAVPDATTERRRGIGRRGMNAPCPTQTHFPGLSICRGEAGPYLLTHRTLPLRT